MSNRVCLNCGSSLSDGARFCSECGSAAEADIAAELHKPEKYSYSGYDVSSNYGGGANKGAALSRHEISVIVKNSILLLISVLLFVFAFLPIFKAESEFYEDGYKFKFNISAVDSIILFFDSLKQYDEDDIKNSDLGEDLEALYQKIDKDFDEDSLEGLTSGQRRLVENLHFYRTRTALQLATYKPAGYVIMSMVLSALYLLAALSLLIISVWNLVLAVLKKKDILFKPCLNILFAMPALILTLYFSLTPYSAYTSKTIGAAAICSIVLCVLFAIYLLVSRCIESRSIEGAKIIKNLVCIALAIVVICLAQASAITTEVETVFSNNTNPKIATVKIPISFFAHLDMSDDEVEIFENFEYKTFTAYFDQYSQYTRREVESWEMKTVYLNIVLLSGLSCTAIEIKYVPLFSFAFIFAVIAVFAAGLLIMQNLLVLATGNGTRWLGIAARVACLISTVLVLAIAIAYTMIASYPMSVWKSLDDCYRVMIGVAPFFTVAFSAGTLFIRINGKEKTPKRNIKPISDEIFSDSALSD